MGRIKAKMGLKGKVPRGALITKMNEAKNSKMRPKNTSVKKVSKLSII